MNTDSQEAQPEYNEVVVGVFDDVAAASRASASLRGAEVKIQRVSRSAQAESDEMPEIHYEEIEEGEGDELVDGLRKGGMIGAGSGLIFLGIPGVNVIAPFVGSIVGAWIGAVAGVAEANQAKDLPNPEDYEKMLNDGKSVIVIAGDEKTRIDYAAKLKNLGASSVHQHPPVGRVFHSPEDND